jgi:hypothetical protein
MDKLRLSILFFIILPMAFSCNAQNSDRDLFGVWNGERDGNEIIFKFNKDHTVVFSFRDEVSGSVITINGDFETFRSLPIRCIRSSYLIETIHFRLQILLPAGGCGLSRLTKTQA